MANLIDLLKQAISTKQNFTEMVNTSQQDVRVATTPEERSEGLRNQPQGTSMVFPNSTGSFNTKGMKYNIDINKYDNQGHLVQSYESVPPGIENLPMGNKTGTVVETPSEYRYGGKVYQTEGTVIPYSKQKGRDDDNNKTYYTREEEVELAQRPGYHFGTITDPEHMEQNEYMQKYVNVSEKDIKKKYRKKKYKNREKELTYYDWNRSYNPNNRDISFSEGVQNETRKEWRQRNKQERDQELQEFAEWPQKVQELKNKEWAEYNQYRHETPEGNIAKEKAIAYFTNYYESPKFKQRVIDTYGKKNYKKIKAEKIQMLNAIDFYETNPADYMEEWERQDLMSNKEFREHIDSAENEGVDPLLHLRSTYDHRTHKAQYNLGESENYGKMDPASVVVNEITHATGSLPQRDVWEYDRRKDKYYPNPERFGAMSVMPDSEIKIAQKRKPPFSNPNDPNSPIGWGHDSYPYEVKSDIESTRYELYDSDMYDFNDPNFKFTKKHIDYMRNNPEKFTKFSKTLSRDYEDEVILEMMNTFVSNDEITDDTNPNRSMQAKKGGFVKKFKTGGTDESGYMKIFYEEGDKTFESEAKRMTAALNQHYGKGNYEFIPIDLSSHNKETISKNVGSHIQNSSSSTDFTILGHNKSKLNSLFISEELQNKFGKETPDTVDTWSEIFATYKPENYSGTCYFGSCMMGDEDRLHNFNKTYAQSFTDESGVASKASVGSWTGIKQGIKTDTFDIAFFDPENISGSGGQYISINEEVDSNAYGTDYDPDPNNLVSRTLTQAEREQIVLSEIEESSGPPSFGSENTSSTSSAYDADGNYIPQSQRKKHGGVVKFREEGMRTQAGTLIQKGLNLFRSDDKKVDPYYKDATSFAGEVSGVIGNRKRINLLKDPEWAKNNDSLYTYSNIDDIWNLQEKGYISAETAVWHITEGIEYPRSHYKEEDDIIRNYLHSDKYKERIEMYGNYEDPDETIKLRQEAFEDLTVYHRNNVYYFASEALNRKLEEDNSLSYGDAAYPDATGKFGTVGSNIMYSFISMHPYKREYSSPESEGSYKSTYAHEVGHAIGGRREDSPVELSFNDWLNLAEGNKEFQEAPFTKTQPGTRGITAGGKIRSQKLNYWLETGNYIDEIYEAPYFKKSGWDMDFYYRHTDYRQYNTVQHLTFWGDGPGKFPIYDELNEIEKKWHNTKPGSKERKNIQDQILSMFENIDGSNYNLPNDYPNIEDWRNLAHEEKVALGRTWIAGLNQRHAFNNIRRADESVNPYSATPPDYLPHYSDDMYQFDVSSIEEYLNNYDFVSRKSKKSAFKKLETLSNKSWERDGVQYLSQRHLDSIIQGISIDEYNSMYKTDNGKELFEADRVALDIFRGKSIELEMDSRKIEGTPTGKQVPEVGMKSVTGSTVHDIGPTEAYSDLTAFRVWVAKDLGIPIEQDWDESTWNYIMREFEKLENKSWENEKGTRDRYLTIKRFIEHFGKEWKGWDEGAAGKHNTVADVDLDLIKNEGDMSNPSTISKTGGFTNYKKGGAVQYQEEGMLDKPSNEESNTKRRNYWLNLNSNKNFVQRILDPSLNIGREVQHPSTGLSMTHYMTSVEVQGQNLVIPQVVDLGEEKLHFFADVNEAIQYALENGEYIITDTKEEAEWLATENYKTKKFKNTYGHGTHKMGGWAHMPKYDTSHQKITKFQEEGFVYTTATYTGRSVMDDEIDKKFLQDLMTKVVEDRKGKGSVEDGINKIIDLFNFTARQESFYNPVKNAEGTLPYNDTGIQDDKNNPNPALSMYQWKPQGLETTIQRVKNYIGDNFMEQADAYGFIDDEAKAGSKFMPYWFTELQEHKDPRKLSKTQLDILLLLDYAGGDAKLTDYIQGKIDPVDFYLKYHHRGKEGQNPMGVITKDAKEKYNDFLLEKKEGHYDKYNAFKEGGIKK